MSKLINLSEATSIAIHSLALIAVEDQQLNANQISKITAFSKNHLSKVLQILVKHGYLNSVRGPRGGFTLNVDPSKVSLLEIFDIFEGEINTNHCYGHHEKCPFVDCIYGDIIDEVTIKFKEAFSSRTIADVRMKKDYQK